MRKIEEIDENFAIDKHGEKDGKKRYDVCDEPFTVYGVMKPKDANDMFRRMPQEVADSVSDNVANLSRNTAGGRIRFCTDSSYIGIYSKLPCIGRMPHFALTGSAGFDLYIEENGVQKYIKTYVPDYNTVDTVDGYVEVLGGTMKEYTLNMPLYSDVSKVQIILDENATVKKSRPYKYSKPVVYYGSSITQGGCASRPGNSYQAVLSRRLDCDYINLGFSGSALGEDEIAEYISKLDMSVFVYDYDCNAPNAEHLRATHEKMFKTIREKQPDLPIICMSYPTSRAKLFEERKQIVMTTVKNAKSNGDENVYFVNGAEILNQPCGEDVSVDGTHPNDLGFFYMANNLEDTLKKALG